METLIISVLVLFFLFITRLQKSPKDPFRYIWNLELLKNQYNAFQPEARTALKKFYENARIRIIESADKKEWLTNSFLPEVECIMRTRRSIDVLRQRAWQYAKELAISYGYNEDETNNDSFYCPGWNELWELYHKNKDRILFKTSSRKTSHDRWNKQSDYSNGDSAKGSSQDFDEEERQSYNYNTSFDDAKNRNEQIFKDIWDINELKKKYFRLAKLNHPDHGGSNEAMKLLNHYYQEAMKRVLNSGQS